ncbi:MAG TPA: hypothetical protein PL045_01815, partial [Chitinophagaceae bacterium]|nr:hypothetical protein [Chitinophagaceae bacterium]
TNPVTDVLDAVVRDNTGVQLSLRFINTFKSWLQQNTSKVVLVQIHDRIPGNWERPYILNDIFSFITKPALLLQNNWFKLQDYYFSDAVNYFSNYFGAQFQSVTFHYIPSAKNNFASISFHLTASEKKDVENSLSNALNDSAMKSIKNILK